MKWPNEGKPIQLGILSFARRVSIVNGIIESANGNRAIYPITIGESLQTLVEREQNSFFLPWKGNWEEGKGARERGRGHAPSAKKSADCLPKNLPAQATRLMVSRVVQGLAVTQEEENRHGQTIRWHNPPSLLSKTHPKRRPRPLGRERRLGPPRITRKN